MNSGLLSTIFEFKLRVVVAPALLLMVIKLDLNLMINIASASNRIDIQVTYLDVRLVVDDLGVLCASDITEFDLGSHVAAELLVQCLQAIDRARFLHF